MRAGIAFRRVGVRDDGSHTPLYPCVGLHSADECIQANFGRAPFVFAIEQYIAVR